MEFVNDPQPADVPRMGGEPVLVAVRTECGKALLFDSRDQGDVEKVIEFFAGAGYLMVEGKLYRRSDTGALHPMEFEQPMMVAVVPPAGDPMFVSLAQFTQRWARVVVPPFVPEVSYGNQSSISTFAVEVSGSVAGADPVPSAVDSEPAAADSEATPAPVAAVREDQPLPQAKKASSTTKKGAGK